MRTYPRQALQAFIIIEIVATIIGVAVRAVSPFHPQMAGADALFYLVITYGFYALAIAVPAAMIIHRAGQLPFLVMLVIAVFACAFIVFLNAQSTGRSFALSGFLQNTAFNLIVFIPMGAVAWMIWSRWTALKNNRS